ncbi:MAG: sulfatase, partial [Candidatus Hydrogenedentes bacterium]|nr:sulfatase [Candidatus Hydrogenedentota bacterium]
MMQCRSVPLFPCLVVLLATMLGPPLSPRAELLRLPPIAESVLRTEPAFAPAADVTEPDLLNIQAQMDAGDLAGALASLRQRVGYWQWESNHPESIQAVGERLAAAFLEKNETEHAIEAYSLVGRAWGRLVDYLYDLAARLPVESKTKLWPEYPFLYVTTFSGPKEEALTLLAEQQGRELVESRVEQGEGASAAMLKLGETSAEAKGQSWYGLHVPGLVITDKPFGIRCALDREPVVATRIVVKYWIPQSKASGEIVFGEQSGSESGAHYVQSGAESLHLKEMIRQRHRQEDTAGTGLVELGVAFAAGPAVDLRMDNFQVYLTADWKDLPRNALPSSVIHRWDFNEETPSWEAVQGIEGLTANDGMLKFTTTSNEALLRSPGITINADYVNCVEIRMKLLESPQGGKGAFYWSFADYDPEVNAGLPFGEPRVYFFQVKDGWQICRLNLHEGYDVDWWGRRTMLALNPVRRPGMAVQVDYVALLRLNDVEMRALSNVPEGRQRQGVETRPVLYTTNVLEQHCPLQLTGPATFRTGLAVADYSQGRADDQVEFLAAWRADGKESTVLRYALGAERSQQYAKWEDVSVDLRRFAGQQGELVLSTRWSRNEQREAPPLLAAWGAPVIEMEDETPPPQPNILLVCIDTLRADAVGAYGDASGTSPNIDALAARSIVYDNAYSSAPWTWHSVCSFMTSLYVRQFSKPGQDLRLQPELVTLAEQLAEQGYATAAFSLNGWVSELTGLGQGFDSFFDLVTRQEIRSDENFSGRATEAAMQWLDQHRDRPFFLYVHYLDPHASYVPVPWTRVRFATDAEGVSWLAKRGRASWASDTLLRKGTTTLTDKDVVFMKGLYDEEVLGVDEHVGRMIDSMALYGL